MATDSARSQVEGDRPVLHNYNACNCYEQFSIDCGVVGYSLATGTGIYRNIFSDDGVVNKVVQRMPVSDNFAYLPDLSRWKRADPTRGTGHSRGGRSSIFAGGVQLGGHSYHRSSSSQLGDYGQTISGISRGHQPDTV